MDNENQAETPEIKAEAGPSAEPEQKSADAGSVAVIAALAVEAKKEMPPVPAPVIAPPPPAPVAPPPMPITAVKVAEPAAAPAVGVVEAKAAEPTPAVAEEKKSENASATRRAFVIEDDFDASEIFGKAMEANGLEFEVINTGNRAIERLNEVTPDIVVLDMHLPNVDGTQILAHIRKTERLEKTLVIVVTADARVGELVKADADLVVLKPATYTQVRDFASRLLRRYTVSL